MNLAEEVEVQKVDEVGKEDVLEERIGQEAGCGRDCRSWRQSSGWSLA